MPGSFSNQRPKPRESGRSFRPGRFQLLLAYPGSYGESLASLGYLQVLRLVEGRAEWSVQRILYEQGRWTATLEEGRSPREFPLVGISLAYELQLPALVRLLGALHMPVLSEDRAPEGRLWEGVWPMVVVGGPLAGINPGFLGAFADAVFVGEAEGELEHFLDLVEENPLRQTFLESLARRSGWYVPRVHGPEWEGQPRRASVHLLPAHSGLWSPDSVLRDMYLVEVSRGCSGSCTFCSLRRERSGGARFVEADSVLSVVPGAARRVGLVGAEVSRHPQLPIILDGLADRGVEVGLSSVRADRATPELLERLAALGMETLTIAADGPSERLRRRVRKRVTEEHLLDAARAAKAAGLRGLKVYQILGLPGETQQDLEEMAVCLAKMSAILPLHLAVSFFVPKPGTPLASAEPLDLREARRRRRWLSARLAHLRVTWASPREARVEWLIDRAPASRARAFAEAVEKGEGLAGLERALAAR